MVNVDWNVCWWKRNVLVLLFSLGISCSGICLCWETDSLRGNDPSISSLKGTKGFHSHWKTWKSRGKVFKSSCRTGKNVTICFHQSLQFRLMPSCSKPSWHLLVQIQLWKYQNSLRNLFNFNIKDTRTTSITSFWCLYY